MKCFSVKKMALGDKKSHFCVFLMFFLVSSTSAQRSQENLVESIKKATTRLEKAGMRHEGGVVAFGCDRSADLVPKSVKKVEIWPKRHPKHERTRVWKCKIAVYGIALSVVSPQITNCNFCSGLRQPGADTVRKTCNFRHFRA